MNRLYASSVFWVCMLCMAPLVGAESARTVPNEPESVFDMPGIHRRHQQLAMRMQAAHRSGDFSTMAQICREGVALLPQNPVWRYNLACALARQGRVTEALENLETAVAQGFRRAEQIKQDEDLASLRHTTHFRALLDQARTPPPPPSDESTVKRATPVVDGVARVSESNTVWNLDSGHFQTLFSLPDTPADDRVTQGLGEPGERVNRWYREGKAAGNHGDYYDNRDAGHSALNLDAFPQVTRIVYDAEATEREAHWGLATFHFLNATVVGNASSARTGDAFWRSIPRMAMADPQALALMVQHYTSNHLYVYPSHHDFRPGPDGHPGHGDTFFANTPMLLISRGSSYTDQPLLEAAFLGLAAFRPDVKTLLRRNHLLMPTLQMLLRKAALSDPSLYLSGAAHPVCFEPDTIDRLRLVEMAQAMTTNRVPPLVQIRLADGERMIAGRDFFDVKNAEGIFDTPFATARVMRGMPYRRSYRVTAQASRDINNLPLTFHWIVLQGDPERVTIRPLNEAASTAQIELEHHRRFAVSDENPITSTRVDIGVFAHNGHTFSAPSMLSFFYLDNEQRTYHSDGRILSVDYAAARDRYVDPLLSLPRNWRDDYRYTPDDKLIGWMRLSASGVSDFTAHGFRVERKDRRGRALTARTVRYVVRSTDDRQRLPELVEVPDNIRVNYEYENAGDLIGRIAGQEPIRE